MYDVQLANTFPLGPNENMHMQHIVWAPYINSSTNVNKVSSTTTTTTTTTTQNTEPTKPSFMSSSLLLSSLANNNKTKANGIDSDDNDDNINNSSLSSSDSTSSYKIYSSNQLMLNQQAIAYVYKNDIYYKPKVQGDQIYRITETGNYMLLNYLWPYLNN